MSEIFSSRRIRILLLSGAVLCIVLVLAWLSLSYTLTQLAAKTLKTSGFTHAQASTARINLAGVYFDTIRLDRDGFSKVSGLSLGIAPLAYISGGPWLDVRVDALTLMGRIDETGQISLAGARPVTGSGAGHEGFRIPDTGFLASADINDIRIDLITPAGGITADAEIDINRRDRDILGYSYKLESAQKELGFQLEGQGRLMTDRLTSHITLQGGRMEIKPYELARLSGEIHVRVPLDTTETGRIPGLPAIESRLQAGSAIFHGIGFQNINAQTDTLDTGYLVTLRGEAAGFPELSFDARMDIPPDPGSSDRGIEARLTLPDLKGLLDYLSNIPALSERMPLNKLSRRLTLKSGRAVASATLPLPSLQSIGKKAPHLESADHATGYKIPGQLGLESVDAVYGEVDIQGVSGQLRFADLLDGQLHSGGAPYTLATTTLKAGLPLQDVTLTLQPLQNRQVKAQLEGKLAGGVFTVEPVTLPPQSYPLGTTLELKDISLARLKSQLAPQGLDMSGKVDGTLPLQIDKDGNLQILDGTLESTSKGTISYTPQSYPAFLSAENPRLDLVRKSLRDFRYESLALDISGSLSGADLQAKLRAKGNSPASPERPVHFNLNLEGAIGPVIRQMLNNFAPQDKLPLSIQQKAP